MRRAYSMIRENPHYRRDAFLSGLRAADFEVVIGPPNSAVKPDDLLVIWNRYGHVEQVALSFEKQGGTVIVAENGFLSRGGGTPKFDVCEGVEPTDYYALALHGHNGSGKWYVGGPERWKALEIELKPWHEDRGHILICPNRTFGSRLMAPPNDWPRLTKEKWLQDGRYDVRLRPHPGNDRPKRELHDDFPGCAAMAIWASSAGVHALIEGIPVYCDSEFWICKDATVDRLGCLKNSNVAAWDNARLKAMISLSWAQWTCAEIETGLPFARLLEMK